MALLPLSLSDKLVAAMYSKQDESIKEVYYLLVDLNNASGSYKHQAGDGIHLGGVVGNFSKNEALDDWIARIGVVTAISGTDASVAFIAPGTSELRTSGALRSKASLIFSPLSLNLTIAEGVLALATNSIDTITALTTSTDIEDISGASRPAEVGDLVMQVLNIEGSGVLSFDFLVWYWVE